MSKIIEGTVHGRTIALRDDPGLAEGQRVEVVVRPLGEPAGRAERLEALAGSLADRPEEDWEALDAILRDRRRWPHRDFPE